MIAFIQSSILFFVNTMCNIRSKLFYLPLIILLNAGNSYAENSCVNNKAEKTKDYINYGVFGMFWGETLCYLPHGHGLLYQGNGSIYIGEWHNGKRHGHGVIKQYNKTIYNGDFYDDLPNGYGIFIINYQTIYIGEFRNGLAHGKGTIIIYHESEQHGSWIEGFLDGKAITYDNYGNFVSHDIYEKGKKIKNIGKWDGNIGE